MNRIVFSIVAYFFMFLWSATTLIALIWRILTDRKRALKKVTRDVPPECLLDKSLGDHEYVTANGIKFHYVTAGDKSKPLMLFLHGFPEFWFSWRNQIREFSKDYHVVAVDLRGYGETERPPRKEDYTLTKLTQDIVELVPALGHSKCVLVSHDWGGVIAWRVVNFHPEVVDRFIIMNCPHFKVYAKRVSSSWSQFMKSWYIFLFQVAWLPEYVIRLYDYGMLKAMFTGKKAGSRNTAAFPPDVIEAYKYTFSQPGALTAAFNYYRSMFSQSTSHRRARQIIEVPSLILWGDDDYFLDAEMADQHGPVVANVTVKHIPNCSHWVQQDAPELTNQYIREFLETNAD